MCKGNVYKWIVNNNIVTESKEFKFSLNATVRCAHITPTGLLKLKLYFYLCIIIFTYIYNTAVTSFTIRQIMDISSAYILCNRGLCRHTIILNLTFKCPEYLLKCNNFISNLINEKHCIYILYIAIQRTIDLLSE